MPTALARAAKVSVVVALPRRGARSPTSAAPAPRDVRRASAQTQETAATGVFHGVGVVTAVDGAKGWLTARS